MHRAKGFPHGRNQPRAFFVVSQECQSLTRAPLSAPRALKLTDHKVLTEQTVAFEPQGRKVHAWEYSQNALFES